MSDDSKGSGIWRMESAEGAARPKEDLALGQVDEFGFRLLDFVGLLRHESLKAEAGG